MPPPPLPYFFRSVYPISSRGQIMPITIHITIRPAHPSGFSDLLRTSFLYVHIKTCRRFARSYRFLMGSPLWFLYRPHCYAKFVAKTAAVEAPSGHCFLCMCSTCNLLFSLESAGPTDICLLSIWQHCTKLRLDRIQSSDNL